MRKDRMSRGVCPRSQSQAPGLVEDEVTLRVGSAGKAQAGWGAVASASSRQQKYQYPSRLPRLTVEMEMLRCRFVDD